MRGYRYQLQIVCFFVVTLVSSCAFASTTERSKMVVSRASVEVKESVDSIYSKDGWTLTIYINNKGTRSQGSHGVLTHDGKEVVGHLGQNMETPIGILRYAGPKQNLWDASGWKITKAYVEPDAKQDVSFSSSRSDQKKLEKDVDVFMRENS